MKIMFITTLFATSLFFNSSCNKELTTNNQTADGNLIMKMAEPSYFNDFILFSSRNGRSIQYSSGSVTNNEAKYITVNGKSMPTEAVQLSSGSGGTISTIQKGKNTINGKEMATTVASYSEKLSKYEVGFFNSIFGKKYVLKHTKSTVDLEESNANDANYIPEIISISYTETAIKKGASIVWNADENNKVGVVINIEAVGSETNSRKWYTILVPDNGQYVIPENVYNKFKNLKGKDVDIEIGRGIAVENAEKAGTELYTKVAFITTDYFSTKIE